MFCGSFALYYPFRGDVEPSSRACLGVSVDILIGGARAVAQISLNRFPETAFAMASCRFIAFNLRNTFEK